MSEEEQKDDLFLTPEGETLGYISLEQARVVAMRTARDQPGDYGRRFSGMRMVFDMVQQEEGEDYYIVTLSMRPEGDFEGMAGKEQFFIAKEGNVAHRQVLALPRMPKKPFPKGRVAIGTLLAVIVAAVVVIALGPRDDGQTTNNAEDSGSVVVDGAGEGFSAQVIAASREEGFTLNLGGFYVEPGQTVIQVPNGNVFLSEPPDDAGKYPSGMEMTLEAVPKAEGSEIVWDGVDSVEGNDGNIAVILIDGDRFIKLEIRPPFEVEVEPGLEDDFGDSIDTAAFLEFEGPGEIRGVINHPFDLDYFGFYGEEGSSYVLDVLLDTHPDTLITLYDQDGKYLAENDDIDSENLGSTMEFQAPYNGDYFLEVRSANQTTDVGSYLLILSPLGDVGGSALNAVVDDHSDDRESATQISLGSTKGIINPSNDLDFFRFFAQGLTTYVAEVHLDTHPDTGLVLMADRGQVIDENDNAEGLGRGSRITWSTPPLGRDYILTVGSIDPESGTGSYFLTVEEIFDEHGDSLTDASPLFFGDNFGTIDPPDDVDYFSFFAQAGESFDFIVELDGHPDTVLTLYQARGLKLEANDNAPGLGNGSRITWTAAFAGEYFLEVSSADQDNRAGGYVLYAETLAAGETGPFLIQGQEPRDFATNFISNSNAAEILSYLNSDSSFSQPYFGADMMRNLELSLANLKNQNLYAKSVFHPELWRVPEVRVINESRLEVDSCETWSQAYYTLDSNTLWRSDPSELLPQTITLERTVAGWRMTQVEHLPSANFC